VVRTIEVSVAAHVVVAISVFYIPAAPGVESSSVVANAGIAASE
jgi:hypothetical protein